MVRISNLQLSVSEWLTASSGFPMTSNNYKAIPQASCLLRSHTEEIFKFSWFPKEQQLGNSARSSCSKTCKLSLASKLLKTPWDCKGCSAEQERWDAYSMVSGRAPGTPRPQVRLSQLCIYLNSSFLTCDIYLLFPTACGLP